MNRPTSALLSTLRRTPFWPLLAHIRDTAVSHHIPLYLVGGPVRDLLLERPLTDLDILFEGDAIQMARQMEKQFGGRVVTHAAFGTAVWHLDDDVWHRVQSSNRGHPSAPPMRAIDFITARQERYPTPASLPVVTPADLEADLARRDFTINTLALRLDGDGAGRLIDPFGGVDDLQHKKLRVLHDLSFVDDPTRLLRGARYLVRLDLQFSAETAVLFRDAAPYLAQTTGVRLWHELLLTFLEPNPAAVLRLLSEERTLPYIVPGLSWSERVGEEFARLPKSDQEGVVTPLSYLTVWMLALTDEVETAVLERFELSSRAQKQIRQVRRSRDGLMALPADAKPSQIVAWLRPLPSWGIDVLKAHFTNATQVEWLSHYEEEWKNRRSTIDGNQLIALGLKPGPRFAHILNRLGEAWLDGEVRDTTAEAELLNHLMEEEDLS